MMSSANQKRANRMRCQCLEEIRPKRRDREMVKHLSVCRELKRFRHRWSSISRKRPVLGRVAARAEESGPSFYMGYWQEGNDTTSFTFKEEYLGDSRKDRT